MKSKSSKRKVIVWNYILPTVFGSLLFLSIFSFQMVFLLGISPPIKLFIAPVIVGGAAGFSIGHWKAKTKALYNKLLQHQEALKKTIELKTKELEMLSCTDPLTGLGNRRIFDITIRNEWSRLTRTDVPLSLIMCDIDMFKQYNDTYGHQKGDECLKEVANILKQHANRRGDQAVRYGGEEFCIIMPNTDHSNAVEIAEHLRKSIESLHIDHSTSTVSDVVTVSLGVSSTKQVEVGLDFSLLIKTADLALYQAKNTGRNRIEANYVDFNAAPI